ncbi:hypothetical protein ATKI12_4858 [Kitasatospora sp. Ki12]
MRFRLSVYGTRLCRIRTASLRSRATSSGAAPGRNRGRHLASTFRHRVRAPRRRAGESPAPSRVMGERASHS